jgi:hypothetical protein
MGAVTSPTHCSRHAVRDEAAKLAAEASLQRSECLVQFGSPLRRFITRSVMATMLP